jgi:hypothetical protein
VPKQKSPPRKAGKLKSIKEVSKPGDDDDANTQYSDAGTIADEDNIFM